MINIAIEIKTEKKWCYKAQRDGRDAENSSYKIHIEFSWMDLDNRQMSA